MASNKSQQTTLVANAPHEKAKMETEGKLLEGESRDQMLARVQAMLPDGQRLFDIERYPRLFLKKIRSRCLTFADYGVEKEAMDEQTERGRLLRSIIFVDPDNQNSDYRFVVNRVAPEPRPEVYPDTTELGLAMREWCEAEADFNQCHAWVGKTTWGLKSYRTNGEQMSAPINPETIGAALLKKAIEKGIDLNQQGSAYADEIKPAVIAACKAAGLTPSPTAKRQSTRKVAEEA